MSRLPESMPPRSTVSAPSRALAVSLRSLRQWSNPPPHPSFPPSGLSLIFGLTQYPSIFFLKDMDVYSYTGGWDKAGFLEYVRNRQWEKEKPDPHWMGPNGLLGYFKFFMIKVCLSLTPLNEWLKSLIGDPWATLLLYGTLFLGPPLSFFIYACSKISWKKRKRKRKKKVVKDE